MADEDPSLPLDSHRNPLMSTSAECVALIKHS